VALGSAALLLQVCMKLHSHVYRETVRHSERKTCLGEACALRYQVTLQCSFGNSLQQARPIHCGTRKRLLTLSINNPRQNIEAGFKFYQKPFIYGELQDVPNSPRKMRSKWRHRGANYKLHFYKFYRLPSWAGIAQSI